MNKTSQQIQCPNCKSYKLTLQDNLLILVGFSICVISFVFLFIFFPLGILMGIVGVVVVLASSMKATFWKSHKYICQNCHYKFQAPPEKSHE